ncbi:hypothetical protein MXB_603 [Myxobolus squamalis]|nr:hypothetical protein MXB_603 [Myxobolus squamalis]
MAKRLTRFIISDVDLPSIIDHLSTSLSFANCSWKQITQKCISIMMRDVRNQDLNFKIHIFCPPNGKTLVDFRLNRGDGLEFKRIFRSIKEKMLQLIPALL